MRKSVYPGAEIIDLDFATGPIVVHDTGEVGDDRPTLIFIHGTGGETATHYGTIYPLLAVHHRVIGIDLAPLSSSPNLDEYIEQVLAVINKRVGDTNPSIIGYSLGAVVAAAFAGRHQDKVENLVLIGGWLASDAHQRLRYDIWTELKESNPDLLVKFSTFTAFGQSFMGRRTDAEINALIESRSTTDDIVAQMALNRNLDITDDALAIAAPTLIIGGEYDQMVPLRHSHLLFGAIENSRLVELPCGHALTTERPAHISSLIEDFIADPSAVKAGTIMDPIAV